MLFSIVIITKNEQKYLPTLLKSIESQDFRDFEVIVSDAKSADNTRGIAKEYKCKIIDGGNVVVGRNNGAKAAQGDYIIFLDADMKLPDNTLSLLKSAIDQRNIKICSTFLRFDTHKFFVKIIYFFSNWTYFLIQRIHPQGYGGFIFVKKSIHEKIGGFRDIIPFEDQDYILRASKVAPRYYILRRPLVSTTSRRIEKDGYFRVIYKYLHITLLQLLGKSGKDLVEYDYTYDE